MFCPRCGSNQSEELKFCKVCGANLSAVRKVVDTKEAGGPIEHNKPWFAELAISDAESKRRKEELDHQRGMTADVRRYNEIKAGVITGSVGIGVATFLHVFFKGLVLSGNVSASTAEILNSIWVVGVIPLFIGVALIVNGVFVSKKLADMARQAAQTGSNEGEGNTNPLQLRSADTTQFVPAPYSVTEDTTKHLSTVDKR